MLVRKRNSEVLKMLRMLGNSAVLLVLLSFLTIGFSSNHLELLGFDHTEIVKETKDSEEKEKETKEEIKIVEESSQRTFLIELALKARKTHFSALKYSSSYLETPTPPPEFG